MSVHIGSQITDVGPFAATMERVADLVRGLWRAAIAYSLMPAADWGSIMKGKADRISPAARKYARAVSALARTRGASASRTRPFYRGTCRAPLTRVIYKKKIGTQFLVVDAAMNDLIRPSLYKAYHEIVPVTHRPAEKERSM